MRDVKSRSQRRMEKRQALVLLALVLVVSLVSFTLGMMVGRGVAPKPVAQETPAAAVRMPVTAPPSAPPAAEPAATGEEAGKVNLTFYDTLPKGEEPPLGSGINLPPREGGLPAGQPAAEEQKGSPPPPRWRPGRRRPLPPSRLPRLRPLPRRPRPPQRPPAAREATSSRSPLSAPRRMPLPFRGVWPRRVTGPICRTSTWGAKGSGPGSTSVSTPVPRRRSRWPSAFRRRRSSPPWSASAESPFSIWVQRCSAGPKKYP